MKKVTFDNQAYIAPSWEEMGEVSFNLAKAILKKNTHFDRMVALAKGGLTWSRTLADYLAIDAVSVVHIRFYKGIGETGKQPVILQSLPVSVEGETMLLFDDVADSGETMLIAKQYLTMCGAKNVKTAALFTKPWAKIKPDFTTQTTDAWIIYPHEIRETIELLYKKWQNSIRKKEIIRRFIKLGIDKEQVEFFLKKYD